ncbi:MAG: beta-mannosidase [Clostridia bacterium]|nr:beta-mannosidase [Clostridia bacterium]
MKKPLSLLLAGLLALPFTASAEESVVYEAEKARLTGSMTVKTDVNASGWKVVGSFEKSEDTVEFTIDVPADGVYDFTLTCKGIGGSKINNLLVDGQHQGTFECGSMMYTDAPVRGVLLTAGQHTVTITPSWGWMTLDKLTVTPAQAIPDSVYDVSPTLINPNATENTRKLYAYLCESYGKYTLSGQVCDKGLNGPEIKAIHKVTGKYPAILGLDMMDYTPSRRALGASNPTSVEQAVKFHEEGGIVTFCWHWGAPKQYILDGKDENGNPRWWGAFYTKNVTFDIEAVMNGTDPVGKEHLDKDIAGIAEQLLRLQEKDIPVLWRPLHEASGGWFWWGAKGAEPCKQLWIYLYDQLTNVYGCNNLIWVWNGQSPDWYPGDQYVDIIGEDIYADNHAYGAQNSKFIELLDYSSTNKIIALTENGVLFDIDNVISTNARWAWFNTWSGDFVQRNGKYSEVYTEAEILNKTYNSEYVITLDELPDLY